VKEPDIITSALGSGSTVFYGWVVIFFAVFAIAVTNGILLGGMPFFYRSFIDEFGWNRTTIATAGSVLLVSRGLIGPFAGPLWDRYGPKRFMVVGGAVIGAALLFASRIGAPMQLYLALLIMSAGLTFAGMGPGAYLASNWFTAKRGVAMGVVATATSLGGIIFSPISTKLIAGYGWRSAMMIYAGFMLVVFAPSMSFFIKNRPAEIGASADPDEADWFLRRRNSIKSVFITAVIVGVPVYSPAAPFLTVRFGKHGAVLIFAALGIICLGVLMKYFSTNAEKPPAVAVASQDPSSGATMWEAISSGSYWILLLGSSLCYSVIFAIVQQFILHLQSPLVGFSPAEAAWAYSALFFFSLSGKSLFGFLSDRFEKRAVNLASGLMTFAGALLILKINQSNIWFFCLLFGLGYGGVTVTTRLVLAELFGLRSLGKLLAIMMSAETILGGGGNLLTGRLFDTSGSYQSAFKIMAVCSTVSVILMAMLGLKPLTSGVKPDFSRPR
jgi:MFS family permease